MTPWFYVEEKWDSRFNKDTSICIKYWKQILVVAIEDRVILLRKIPLKRFQCLTPHVCANDLKLANAQLKNINVKFENDDWERIGDAAYPKSVDAYEEAEENVGEAERISPKGAAAVRTDS